MNRRPHANQRYVKLAQIGLAALALAFASPVRAETVYPGQVTDARFAVRAGFSPLVAFTVDGPTRLEIAQRSPSGWRPRELGLFQHKDVEIDGLEIDPNSGQAVVLLRQRDGAWLAIWHRGRLHAFHRDSKQARFGPAGLALDHAGRPVVAYALWFPSHKTFLRLARFNAAGKASIRPVTKGGFPSTPGYASAAPVVLGNGKVRVVETFVPGAIDWGLDGWGQLLFSSALGVPSGGVLAAAAGSTLYAAWTELFPTLGPPGIVLARRTDHVESAVVLEDAVLADLALTPDGPELAANRCIPAAAFGAEGNGVCGGLANGVGVDGVIAGYAAAGPDRQLLIQTTQGLEWFDAPQGLTSAVTLNADLTGRVEGASGGTVALYRERPEARTLIGSFPVAAEGSFAGGDPTATAVTAAYRAVYVDRASGIPYAALIGPPS